MSVSSRFLTSSFLSLLLGCGAAGHPVRAVPDAAGAYELDAERTIPAGATWDEHAVSEHEERRVTRVLTNEELSVERRRVELVGHVTVLEGRRSSIAVESLSVDDGTGVRAIVPPGATLTFTHGDESSLQASSGPLSDGDRALVLQVVTVGDGEEESASHASAAAAFGPPGGRAAVGQPWVLDDAALAGLFASHANGATVRREDVGGSGLLRERAPWEGHDTLEVHLDIAIHDMTVPLPAEAVLDDVELEIVGDFAWPLDLNVPAPEETMRTEIVMSMRVATANPEIVVGVSATIVDGRQLVRSNFHAP